MLKVKHLYNQGKCMYFLYLTNLVRTFQLRFNYFFLKIPNNMNLKDFMAFKNVFTKITVKRF